MESQVAKMYENAGVKTDRIVCYRGFDNCIYNDFNCHCHNEKPCKDAAKIYPPFSAEKQLELIKWVLTSKNTGILKFEVINGKYEVYDTYYECDKYRESLDEALADYICCLWQDLTEQERTEIAEILKG